MKKIETVEDFKRFINTNRNKFFKQAIKIEDLPIDDEWLQEDEWDEIYKQEVICDEKIRNR